MTQITLTTTKEQLQKAADRCPEAKKILETLFPEQFERKLDLARLIVENGDVGSEGIPIRGLVVRDMANNIIFDNSEKHMTYFELGEFNYFIDKSYIPYRLYISKK